MPVQVFLKVGGCQQQKRGATFLTWEKGPVGKRNLHLHSFNPFISNTNSVPSQ
jgi:hypothetical protein